MTIHKTWLDKFGFPVERIKGRWVRNFIRILIHARRYSFYRPNLQTDDCAQQEFKGPSEAESEGT